MPLNDPEKAILVGIEIKGHRDWPLDESLSELASLAHTAGASVVSRITQSKDKPDSKYYIGSGKLIELKSEIESKQANLIIFDCELSPSQTRNLEEQLGVKVVDRTSLILDIFAQNAHSREGKLQVELAQTSYILTHLIGKGELMSRLGGGIGTRGPGETKLETDRRVINSKISRLRNEIEKVSQERALKRVARQTALLPVLGIVGYTNAGKSTLLNTLTNAGVLVKNKLFATLDPTTRRLNLPSKRQVLITDTVGFIHKLPHQLVEAFHATLEEISEADILIHVIDSTSEFMDDQVKAVFRVLEEINSIAKPIITVFNKADATNRKPVPDDLKVKLVPNIEVSALSGLNIDKLLQLIDDELESTMICSEFKIPMNKMDIVNLIHKNGIVENEKYEETGVFIRAKVTQIAANRLKEFIIV